MLKLLKIAALVALSAPAMVWASFVTFEAAGSDPASITTTRDAFRVAVGGGTVAGANGSFGGVRREINWDGVPGTAADPNPMPANFFNSNSPRGLGLSTPGTGFMVSANAGLSTPTLFGFGSDFQTFSAQRLFTAINSNITDVSFFEPGTSNAATTSAFGVIFVDVEVANLTRLEFFDENDQLIFSRFALAAGNQGLSFVGAVANAGETISRVRITSGLNTIVSNGVLGNPNDDVVVMDDFIYAEPTRDAVPVPEPSTLPLMASGVCLLVAAAMRRARRRANADASVTGAG
jgi:hypothetical protein